MALPVARATLEAAVVLLATGDAPAADRLQAVWSGPLTELWQSLYP